MCIEEAGNCPQRLCQAYLQREMAEKHVAIAFREIGRRFFHQRRETCRRIGIEE